jgi:Bacterial TSP3 repeat
MDQVPVIRVGPSCAVVVLATVFCGIGPASAEPRGAARGNPHVTAGADCPDHDGDGLSTPQERTLHHTDPRLADTDADGLSDGLEWAAR